MWGDDTRYRSDLARERAAHRNTINKLDIAMGAHRKTQERLDVALKTLTKIASSDCPIPWVRPCECVVCIVKAALKKIP